MKKYAKIREHYSCPWVKIFAAAITLYPFIFYSQSKEEVPHTMRIHEWIHVWQVRKVGWLRFYLSYVWNYIKIKNYYQIPYEAHAFTHEALPWEPWNWSVPPWENDDIKQYWQEII